ncbi:ArgP/LysG family DNA-binding transcriptional regulator [Corynebacterium lizhenjunii]|uniref:ArgP/LysG family DNA-binding transcriptional regulator n=1 Tax=Corynebacterium lizhenjunii TaxID=2709394 RepID=A0A7T0KHL1_9CORY|nr:ArgP/LysG family DNA-binding transcriptional regulator [Corynebacterium lizhenjunii]QPK80044.1 ArgP/LysG family DNA-binding transcriptional regulator [Corynebacterium lizhenjunii]
MNQTHLETLLAIVEEGSFEDAATVLGISPSAVSQRIKALESSTGRVLLRRALPVTPTEAGEVLVQTARRVALVHDEARRAWGERMRSVPLSVAVNADSLHTWFAPVIAAVANHTDAALRIRVEDEVATLGMLRRGDVMGAVTSESTPVAGCESTRLGAMRYFAVAAPSLAQSADTALRTGRWHELPLVLYSQQDPVLKEGLRRHGIGLRDIQARVSYLPNIDAHNEAVRAGLGWGLIPQLQAQPLLDSGELVVVDPAPLDLELYWQCWRLDSELLERLNGFVYRAAQGLATPA